MDPATAFCPHLDCLARGQTGQGNLRICSRKARRFLCLECRQTFTATKGTVLYRLRISAETVTLVVTLLAHGCPLQAIVVAFGFDERTVAAWLARAGQQGQAVQAYLVEQPRDLGQVQADEIRVKKQGGVVWMALAMIVSTRLWLAGEVSEHRDLPLIRRLIKRVRTCAMRRTVLFCTDGLCAYVRAICETVRDVVRTGTCGRPRIHPWKSILITQIVKRYATRRVVAVERRIVQGSAAQVEQIQCRSQGDGVMNTAYIERLNATFRERLSSLTRRGRALSRQAHTLRHGMYLIGTVDNFCTPHEQLWCLSSAILEPGVPRGVSLHHGVQDREELAHSSRYGHFLGFPSPQQAWIEGFDDRVTPCRGARGHG